jgi:hypothetical protein
MKKIITTLLLISGLATAQVTPVDGFWRTTDDPEIGSGLLMTTQGGVTLISLFTYDDEGKNSWYIASAQVDENGLFEAELFQTRGGTSIVSETLHSAEVFNTEQHIKIQFSGNQIGELSVGDSANKSIQAFHFGLESWQTEHQTLSDGTFYTLPELDGQWVVGAAGSNVTMVFDLQYDPILSDGWLTAPYQGKVYLSQHPSTQNFAVSCPWKVNSSTDPVLTPFCTVYSENFDEQLFTINYSELGGEKMLLRSTNGNPAPDFEAFRVNSQSQVHNGHWRTHDDPAVGSGLYLVTQGNITLALLYSYQEDGTPEWGIATGQIDESSVLQAELLMPTGGKPFYFGTPTAATLMEESKSLTLSFQGAEVGAISIDGSEPKTMQRYNYGVELFETEQITFDDQSFKYPGQAGNWLMYDEQSGKSYSTDLEKYDPNSLVSPIVPHHVDANAYRTMNQLSEEVMNFICVKLAEVNNEAFIEPYCTGFIYFNDMHHMSKIFFEDIGANHFKAYISSEEVLPGDIDRSNSVVHFYKLTE